MQILILAAGLSTRFGSLKQFYEIDDKHNFIMDYSINNACKAGFNDFIIVIRKEYEEIFLNTIYKRYKDKIKISYCFQDTINKPGTFNACLSAKHLINSSFMIINSDDIYPYNIFKQVYDNYIINKIYESSCICFDLDKTIIENTTVNRAIIETNNNYITKIIESKIVKINNDYYTSNLLISSNTKVSMNIFCLFKDIFDLIINNINLNTNKEIYLPDVINELIKKNLINIRYFYSSESIKGITYKEDIKTLLP